MSVKNFCYELAKLLYDKIDVNEINFASHVETVNDLRSALAGLKGLDKRGLDQDTVASAAVLIDELESCYHGKALYRQMDDIKRNLSGVLRLLKRMRGEEIPEEEVVKV